MIPTERMRIPTKIDTMMISLAHPGGGLDLNSAMVTKDTVAKIAVVVNKRPNLNTMRSGQSEKSRIVFRASRTNREYEYEVEP